MSGLIVGIIFAIVALLFQTATDKKKRESAGGKVKSNLNDWLNVDELITDADSKRESDPYSGLASDRVFANDLAVNDLVVNELSVDELVVNEQSADEIKVESDLKSYKKREKASKADSNRILANDNFPGSLTAEESNGDTSAAALKDGIDPKKLILYSEIMNPKFVD